jgi:tryptophanyl-tRNA synthetase
MDIVFSGIQPSGELHLGNYLGAVRNWVTLQEQYRCFFCIVDLHAITQPYESAELAQRTLDMGRDLLACGIDPRRSTLFVQSHVPQHSELAWVLSTVTMFGELSRMTQFKDKSLKQEDNINAGLFTYPVLQTADIVLYKARHVPIGQDQVQHLELAREIVRRFNVRWGDTFPEPQALLSSTPKILGLDGKAKMSKSLGNTITLSEPEASIRQKLATAATDPKRVRRKDPGNPDDCNVGTLHKFFSTEPQLEWVRQGCTTAGIGCLECKGVLADNVVAHFAPIQARRAELDANPGEVETALRRGAAVARETAAATMGEVKEKVGLWS